MSKKVQAPKPVKEDDTEEKSVKSKHIYTYIGKGEDSPRVIEFMGKQKFIRGQATEVKDLEVLSKITGNPSFVEGEVDQEMIHEIDEEAKTDADLQRREDARINAAFTKKHKTP